jgi:hypothetical protein
MHISSAARGTRGEGVWGSRLPLGLEQHFVDERPQHLREVLARQHVRVPACRARRGVPMRPARLGAALGVRPAPAAPRGRPAAVAIYGSTYSYRPTLIPTQHSRPRTHIHTHAHARPIIANDTCTGIHSQPARPAGGWCTKKGGTPALFVWLLLLRIRDAQAGGSGSGRVLV